MHVRFINIYSDIMIIERRDSTSSFKNKIFALGSLNFHHQIHKISISAAKSQTYTFAQKARSVLH